MSIRLNQIVPGAFAVAGLMASAASAAVVVRAERVADTSSTAPSFASNPFATIPNLSGTDLANGLSTISQLSGTGYLNFSPNSGAPSKLLNGVGQANNNETGAGNNSIYFGNETVASTTPQSKKRILLDLGAATAIGAVNTYSWHTAERSPQVYTLYAATGAEAGFTATPAAGDALTSVGYTAIASVDTRAAGAQALTQGGKHGVSIADTTGTLGSYRYLLWDITAPTYTGGSYVGTFYSEFDVVAAPFAVPEPATLAAIGIVAAVGVRRRRVTA